MKGNRSSRAVMAVLIAMAVLAPVRAQEEPKPRLELLAGSGCLDQVRFADFIWTGNNPLAFDAQGALYAANDSGTCVYRLDLTSGMMARYAGTGSKSLQPGASRLETTTEVTSPTFALLRM